VVEAGGVESAGAGSRFKAMVSHLGNLLALRRCANDLKLDSESQEKVWLGGSDSVPPMWREAPRTIKKK
jgi:hypothetical protein